MPKAYYRACEELAAWMEHSRDSVIGTRPAPKHISANIPITVNDQTWYLDSLPSESEAKPFEPCVSVVEVAGIKKPKSVTLLRTGNRLVYDYADDKLKVEIPAKMRTHCDDVVALAW
jgi:alpha-L-fucosidase